MISIESDQELTPTPTTTPIPSQHASEIEMDEKHTISGAQG